MILFIQLILFFIPLGLQTCVTHAKSFEKRFLINNNTNGFISYIFCGQLENQQQYTSGPCNKSGCRTPFPDPELPSWMF